MSSETDPSFSTAFQKSVIGANLNSTLLFLYLTGGYIGFYVFTLRIYAFTSQSRKQIVTSILTALFVITLGQLIINWYYMYLCFVGETSTREDTFILSINPTPVVGFSATLMQGMGEILSDALLIWRSYHILHQRTYVKLGLICLFMVEVVLIVVGIVMTGLSYFHPSDETDQFSHQLNILQGISLCVTVTASVFATFVIGAQIYSSTSLNASARRRYKHVIEIIIQSSGLYSFSMLLAAITAFIDTNGNTTTSESVVLNADFYAAAIYAVTPALAPTLMVARLQLSKTKAYEEFSTNVMSEPHDTALSSFSAVPQQPVTSEIAEVLERSSTVQAV